MNIGIDARFYRASTAGLGRYSRGLLHNLAKIDKKNQYTVFITAQDDKEYDIKAPNFTKKILNITHYTLSEQTKFLQILNKYNFDLVHFLNFNHPIFYNRPFITTVHDLTMLLFPVGRSQKSLLRKIAFKKVMSSAALNSVATIAVSEATKKDIVKHLNSPEDKIKVIYEAYDHIYHNKYTSSKLQKIKSKYNLKNPYILFVSQWRPHKGLPELISAFEILRRKYKSNLDLVITGKANDDFPQIPHSINQSKYRRNILTPGFIDEADLPLLYNGAVAFIFPSFYEGFGLGGLEAMACGTPVISSDKSCLPEVLGTAAKYFDPNNINQMAETIYQITSDEKVLHKMSQTGLKHAHTFSWEKMACQTLKLYQSTRID